MNSDPNDRDEARPRNAEEAGGADAGGAGEDGADAGGAGEGGTDAGGAGEDGTGAGGAGEGGTGAGGAGEGGGSELGRDPDADPVRIHREYVERRIGGGEPPTTDAYARALEEFHRLPGAVRQPAAETTTEAVRRRTTAPAPEVEPETAEPVEETERETSREDDTGGAWEAQP
ncbi:hypothetical protein [Georgenia yuyongxinii]